MSLNRVVLVGRLTKDPELRYTANGVAVANFTIAVNRPFTNANGDREADFINGVIWRKSAESLAEFMKKGSMIGVDGRIQSRTYEGQDGKTVFVTEIVAESVQFLESKGSQNNSNQGNVNRGQNRQTEFAGGGNDYNGGQNGPIDITDDDLPF